MFYFFDCVSFFVYRMLADDLKLSSDDDDTQRVTLRTLKVNVVIFTLGGRLRSCKRA